MTLSDEKTAPAIRYLSLGWGVQSFTLAAMVALGDLEGLDVAVHADTTHESQKTYDFAARWTPWLESHGLQVVTVQSKRTAVREPNSGKAESQDSVYLPAFTLAHQDGRRGQVKRQCTDNWKIRPLRAYVKTLLPEARPYPGAVECWQGISLDEWHRMRTADVKYVLNRYPLVEMLMSRQDCIEYLERAGLEVPPKSACVFCPFHSLSYWRDMRQTGESDWEYAIAVDKVIRNARAHVGFDLFVHPARVPLELAVAVPEDSSDYRAEFEFDQPCDGGACFT